MVFVVLLVLGMIAGLIGGWKFGQIKNKLPQDYHRSFDFSAVLMLLQDVLIAFYYLRGSSVIVFLLIIFLTPAVGFIAFDRFASSSN